MCHGESRASPQRAQRSLRKRQEKILTAENAEIAEEDRKKKSSIEVTTSLNRLGGHSLQDQGEKQNAPPPPNLPHFLRKWRRSNHNNRTRLSVPKKHSYRHATSRRYIFFHHATLSSPIFFENRGGVPKPFVDKLLTWPSRGVNRRRIR
jgi:hypothetical protein